MTIVPDQSSFVIYVEQELLGTLMLSGSVSRVISIVQDRHFIEDTHKHVYQAIVSACERYNSARPDIVFKLIPQAVVESFQQATKGDLLKYLINLSTQAVQGPVNVEKTARQVVEQWARLALANEASNLVTAASDPASDPSVLVTNFGLLSDDIMSDVRGGIKRKSQLSIASAAQNAFAAAREAAERGTGLTGITWGLTDVDRVTGGIHKRDLTLIGARPSMGKTTIALSVANSVAKTGAGVGFISLEMDADKLAARAISDLAFNQGIRVPYQDIITGKASLHALDSLERSTQEMANLPLLIEEQSGLSITDIRVKLEVMLSNADSAGQSLDMLMIDHLGLIRASNRYSGNRNNEIAEMTSALKSMAREYNIAVVLLSQLNRSIEQQADKRPQLSSLRDSGAIEQDADTIIFLYREAYYLEREKHEDVDKELARQDKLADVQNKLEFHIAKQRNGPVTQVDLFCDVACSAVRNAARSHI